MPISTKKIYEFKCKRCQCTELHRIFNGVLVKQLVTSISPGVIVGEIINPEDLDNDLTYVCSHCNELIARTNKELFEYITSTQYQVDSDDIVDLDATIRHYYVSNHTIIVKKEDRKNIRAIIIKWLEKNNIKTQIK